MHIPVDYDSGTAMAKVADDDYTNDVLVMAMNDGCQISVHDEELGCFLPSFWLFFRLHQGWLFSPRRRPRRPNRSQPLELRRMGEACATKPPQPLANSQRCLKETN